MSWKASDAGRFYSSGRWRGFRRLSPLCDNITYKDCNIKIDYLRERSGEARRMSG